MRNRTLAWIGVIWFGAVLIYSFIKGWPEGEGAYAAGRRVGIFVAGLLFVVSLYYLIKGGGSGEEEG